MFKTKCGDKQCVHIGDGKLFYEYPDHIGYQKDKEKTWFQIIH